jgi:Domain of unknown function (DUF6457)
MERTMYDWAAEAADALALPADAGWVSEEATVRAVLDVAREVAQGVARPAAPVGAFLAGVAVGLAGAGDRNLLDDVRARMAPTLRPAEP